MADLKPISAFNAASAVDANTLFLVSTPNGADYDSENASAALVADAVVNDFEYTQDLSTVSKKVTGAINENKSVIGYSYDEYDPTTAYSKDDLCIYNNTLYKALQATTGNLPTNTTYWEPTSIANEINKLKSASEYQVGDTISGSTNIHCAGRINNAGTNILFTYPLSKPISNSVSNISMSLSGTPLAYVPNGNLAITTGTYSGTKVENGINFTIPLTQTTTVHQGGIANAILANRTITFS